MSAYPAHPSRRVRHARARLRAAARRHDRRTARARLRRGQIEE